MFLTSYILFCLLGLLTIVEIDTVNPGDQGIARWAHEHPVLRASWCQSVTKLGDSDFVKKACGASIVVLLLLKKWIYVPTLLVGVLGEMVVNKWLQLSLERRRPSFPDIQAIDAFAFPSGHTGAAVAFFGFWILFLIVEYRGRAVTFCLIPVLAVCACAVGLSRILLVVHWATDVLGGFCFAVAWLLLCFWITERWQRSRETLDGHL